MIFAINLEGPINYGSLESNEPEPKKHIPEDKTKPPKASSNKKGK